MAGEPDALVESLAGEPALHDPVRGRIKGTRAFEAFAAETSAWLNQQNVSVADVERSSSSDAAWRRSLCTSTVRLSWEGWFEYAPNPPAREKVVAARPTASWRSRPPTSSSRSRVPRAAGVVPVRGERNAARPLR
jgi:hypothetical protein